MIDDFVTVEPAAIGQQTVFAHTANNVSGVLAVACSPSDTTISLSPGGGALFPNAPFYCSIEFEVVWCLSKSGDNLIVQRGMDGTTATSHAVGLSVEMRNNAGLWTDAYNAINSVSTDVGTLQTNVGNKTALPADTVYTGATQELTHKTIDLTDGTKGNVILGNVSPDPSQLVYQNILNNGGFEEWYTAASTTLAAGTPTSGSRSAAFSNFWQMSGINDSAITCARDTSNADPGNQSGVDNLINISTVQAADNVSIWEEVSTANGVLASNADILKLLNNPLSISARVKVLSGTPTFRFRYNNGVSADTVGPWITPTTSYATYKFENQVPIANPSEILLNVYLDFHGVGQLALDNVMLIVGSVATNYRPKFLPPIKAINLLTNGGMEIWQRGNGPFTGLNVFSVDRWQNVGSAATATISVSKDTTNQDTGNVCAAVTFTPGGGGLLAVSQSLVTADINLRGRTLSFSMRIKTSTANAVRAGFYDGFAWNYSAYHNGNGQYQTLTVTASVVAGATYIQLAAWFDNFIAVTAYIDNAMLVIGNIPADYVPLHPADDLARCLRYYERLGGTVTEFLGTGQATNTTQVGAIPIRWKVQKAVTPTVTFDAASQYGLTIASGTQSSATSIGSTNSTVDGTTVYCNTTGVVAGNASMLVGSGTGRIYIESNP